MKFKVIGLILVLIFSIKNYSQSRNEIRILYGFSDSELLRNVNLDGGGEHTTRNFSEYGIKYLRQIKGNLKIETGLIFVSLSIGVNNINYEEPLVKTRFERLEIISVPFNLNYTFGNYFFVNGGPLIDFQTSKKPSDSQSGIGYDFGVGLKYEINRLVFFVNPNYKRHAVIAFKKEKYHQKLTEVGVQFGLGYKY